MPESVAKPCVMMRLAAEALLAGWDRTAGPGHERAIDRFGGRILNRWQEWLKPLDPDQRQAAVAELAALSPGAARRDAEAALKEAGLIPDSARDAAAAYLAAIPALAHRLLQEETVARMPDAAATLTFAAADDLLPLLPIDAPPYSVPCDLPGTPYRLEELVGTGGFGVVYRASAPSLQHLPFAIKFCLDHGQVVALQQERANLERLMKAGAEAGAAHIVRLYGYNLEHATPYLVYEYVEGGDLLRYLAESRLRLGRNQTPDEVFPVIQQILVGLAFAHHRGLVHRDVKPANILVAGATFKLADFGLGGIAANRTARASRLSAGASLAVQATMFRRAGTPLYMSPEQRMGFGPDPRHDLYSLGVMWYQLLVGDTSRELHAGWAKELALRFHVPKDQVERIERCVGWFEERPKDAGELRALMTPAAEATARETDAPPQPLTVTPVESAIPTAGFRRQRLIALLQQVKEAQVKLRQLEQKQRG